MTIRDILLCVVSFSGILCGLLLPGLGDVLDWYPRFSLMLMLFLSFMGLRTKEIVHSISSLKWKLTLILLAKLIIVPIITFGIFLLLMPNYALGALLLSGSPIGIISIVIAMALKADFILTLGAVVFTSLIAPFTLPILTSFGLELLHIDPTKLAAFSPVQMSLQMAIIIFIPYLCAIIFQKVAPKQAVKLKKVSFYINLVTILIANTAVFAINADTLLSKPDMFISAIWSALLFLVIFFSIGALLGSRWSISQQVSSILCVTVTNSFMAMILAIQFFGIYEILPAALFSVVTALVIFPCRLAIRIRTGKFSD